MIHGYMRHNIRMYHYIVANSVRCFFCSIIAFFCLLATEIHASERVGIVDIRQTQQAKVVKNIQVQLDEFGSSKFTIIRQQERSLLKQAAELRQVANSMTSEDYKKNSQFIEKQVRGLKEQGRQLNEVLYKAKNQAMQQVEQMVAVIIRELADQYKIDLILQKEHILFYRQPHIDITDFLLTELDKRLTHVRVTFDNVPINNGK
jgi:Skp family chaperone for outer membrane proteins